MSNGTSSQSPDDEGSITNEDYEEVVKKYEELTRPIDPGDPLKKQAQTTVRQNSSLILSASVYFFEIFERFAKILRMLVDDIESELRSDQECPERGFGWECLKQAVIIIPFGLLISGWYVFTMITPGHPPPPVGRAIEYIHWGFYPVVVGIQGLRYVVHELRKLFD